MLASRRDPRACVLEPPSPPRRLTGMSTHVAASLAGLAVVCTVAGCGTETTSTSSAPPALRLVDNGGSTLAAPALAGGDVGGFELRTTLPSGQPAPAAVYLLPRATAAD